MCGQIIKKKFTKYIKEKKNNKQTIFFILKNLLIIKVKIKKIIIK